MANKRHKRRVLYRLTYYEQEKAIIRFTYYEQKEAISRCHKEIPREFTVQSLIIPGLIYHYSFFLLNNAAAARRDRIISTTVTRIGVTAAAGFALPVRKSIFFEDR